MKIGLMIAFFLGMIGLIHAEDRSKNVLFWVGAKSHGPGEHEFEKGGELLAKALQQSNPGFKTVVATTLNSNLKSKNWDCIVIYCDGLDQHLAKDEVSWLENHSNQGRGLMMLHFALEPTLGTRLAEYIDKSLGGRFEVDWSVNPMWKLENPTLMPHPITRGVKIDGGMDEWYYHLRFQKDIIPLLTANPPLSTLGEDGPRSGNPTVRDELNRKVPQVLSWARVTSSGAKCFGFTGGHFHKNWAQDGFRRLILNAIVWTSGGEVPPQGVDSKVALNSFYTSLDPAIISGDIETVRELLKSHPEWSNRGEKPHLPPLHHSIMRKKSEIALLLIESGASINQQNSSGQTPLHLAVERNLIDVAALLMRKKANPTLLDSVGWTPLHHAAAKDRLEIAKIILDGGMDPNVKSERGGTSLHEAAASGSSEMVRLLIGRGCDPKVVSKTGETALSIATARKDEEVIKLLKAN